MNSSYFAQLCGLPIPWLYDAMDPLTSAPGTGTSEAVVILGHSHILYELHVEILGIGFYVCIYICICICIYVYP